VNTKQIRLLQEAVVRAVPHFSIVGKLMAIRPVEDILRGIHFEGSSFDNDSFYAHMFIMPLCRKTDEIYLNFGQRVRRSDGGDRWSVADPAIGLELVEAINIQVLPFLFSVTSLADFVELAKTFPKDHRSLEAMAFSLARLGHAEEAIATIQKLNKLPVTFPWHAEVRASAMALEDRLRNDPQDAVKFLKSIEDKVRLDLKLTNIR
jgi:hypothetical protein